MQRSYISGEGSGGNSTCPSDINVFIPYQGTYYQGIGGLETEGAFYATYYYVAASTVGGTTSYIHGNIQVDEVDCAIMNLGGATTTFDYNIIPG